MSDRSPRAAAKHRGCGWLTLVTGALLMLPGAHCPRDKDETGIDEALEGTRDQISNPVDRLRNELEDEMVDAL